jgi:hypothetical protein
MGNPRKEITMYRGKGNTAGPKHRARKTSDARLAADIAASILAHQEAGVSRSVTDYTSRIELIGMVEAILGR